MKNIKKFRELFESDSFFNVDNLISTIKDILLELEDDDFNITYQSGDKSIKINITSMYIPNISS